MKIVNFCSVAMIAAVASLATFGWAQAEDGATFAHTAGAADDTLTIVYNDSTGELSVNGPSDQSYTTITLGIVDTADGTAPPADFTFDTAATATWDGQDTFKVSDDATLQGFITAIGFQGTFTMADGDVIGALLAPGQGDLFANHVEVNFNLAGIPGTRSGSLLVVPEPGSIVLALMGLVGLAAYGWRRRKSA